MSESGTEFDAEELIQARKKELAQMAYPKDYHQAKPTPWRIRFCGLPREVSDRIHYFRDLSDFEPTTNQIELIIGYRQGKIVRNALLDTIIEDKCCFRDFLDSRWVTDFQVWKAMLYFFPFLGQELPLYEHLFTNMDLHWLAWVHKTGSLVWDIETLRLEGEYNRLLQEGREHYATCSIGTSCPQCHGNDPDKLSLAFQIPEQLP